MSFWLDRFRDEDEEDIWEELRQMLLNSSSEQEGNSKKEQEQIDAFLQKMFPADTQIKSEKEPYFNISSRFNPNTLKPSQTLDVWLEELKRRRKKRI